MRTTVDIPDAKYRRLKSKAASEGTTVKALVMKGVEVILAKPARHHAAKPSLPVLRSSQPGTLNLDNEQIYDLIGFP
jgi:hypothetical protein